jgi:hypothetical protein
MRALAIKQAISEIKDIEDKPSVEHIAKRHGLGYGELKQAYTKEQKKWPYLSKEDKAVADKAAKLIARDYGEVIKRLGEE